MRNRISVVTLIFLCFSGSMYGRPREERDPSVAAARITVVRETYDKMTLYNKAAFMQEMESDNPLAASLAMKFELGGFHYGPIREIADLPFRALVAPSVTPVLRGGVRELDVNGTSMAYYAADWGAGSYSTVEAAKWTLADVMRLNPQLFYDISSYVSYDVTLSFRGQSRTYQALALFHDLYTSADEPVPLFFDDVAGPGGELNEIWHTATPAYDPNVKKTRLRESAGKPSSAPPRPPSSESAREGVLGSYAETTTPGEQIYNYVESDQAHHYSFPPGYHYAKGKIHAGCEDLDQYNQSCYANAPSDEWDYGDTGVLTTNACAQVCVHQVKMGGDRDERHAGPKGSQVTCETAIAGAAKECVLTCATEIVVKVSKGPVTATVQGGDIWNGRGLQAGITCGLKVALRDPSLVSCGSDEMLVVIDGLESGCYDPGGFNSPILIDVAGDGFKLTDAAGGVNFDLTVDGIPEHTAWTAYGSDDAFLALDRNGNGVIDDGGELFGNHTPQPASSTPNGYIALSEFDMPSNGGNGDGIIDAHDAIFQRLLLWQDANHDGISEPDELQPLSRSTVTALHLDYKESKRTDQYGNKFRYRAKVDGSKDSEAGRWAWDVFFTSRR